MATKAFVLIETLVGRTKEILDMLKQVKGVKSVDMVTGGYDIIVVIEAKSLGDIGDIVTSKIHPIAGISKTVTCLALSSISD